MVYLKNLTVSVSNKNILDNLNFEFKKNRVYALMGPNGSGKSTLAYTIAGHPAYKADKKSKIVFNKKIRGRKQTIILKLECKNNYFNFKLLNYFVN